MTISARRPPLPVIFGCAGPALRSDERAFFRAANPVGFILFARNCGEPGQICRLTAALRDTVERPDALILIDQEGGRVQRLGPPRWRDAPPAAISGVLAERDLDAAAEAVRLNAQFIGADLADLGISVDCAPVLDLRFAEGHAVIGDRSFGADPETVTALGGAFAEGLLAAGVLPVVKHSPGHGRARLDSHMALPRVGATAAELRESDFVPFRALSALPMAMTAHIVYEAFDTERPATLSPTVIGRVIREEIGFNGLLLSDDIGMEALAGPVAERAAAAIAAGCDIVLHCSADLEEMRAVAEAVASVADDRRGADGETRRDAAMARLGRALDFRRPPAPLDAARAKGRLADLLAPIMRAEATKR